MDDPLGLGNYETPLHSATAANPAVQARPGLLGSIASTLEQPFKYFGSVNKNAVKVGAAAVTHNKPALNNALEQYNSASGLGNNGSNVGNFLKKLTGNSVALGTDFVAPEAKAGILARAGQGAKIGAAAGGGTALANNEDPVKGAIEGALTGGTAGGVLGGLAKTGRGAKSVVDNATAKEAASQEATQAFQNAIPFSGIKPKVLSDNNLGGSMELLKSLGMEQTPEAMHNAANLVTGNDGIVNGTMRQILADAPKIDTNGVLDDTDKALVREGGQLGTTIARENTPAKSVLGSIRQELQSTLFHGEGSLNGHADANDVLDAIQNIEGRIRTLGTDGIDGAERRVLQTTRDSLQDKLFNSSGVNDAVRNFKLSADDVNKLHADATAKGAAPTLVNHVVNGINNANRGQDLRSLQKPFVQMSHLADEADKVAAGKGVISSARDAARDAAQGSGYNPATGDIYYSMQNPAMLPFLAGDVLKGGTGSALMSKLSPLATKASKTVKPSSVLTSRVPTVAAQVAAAPQPATPDNTQPQTPSLNSSTQTPQAPSSPTEGPISQSQLLQLVAADPKNAATYISLYKTLQPDTSSSTPKPTAQNYANALSGLSSIQQLRGLMESDPNVVRNASTPGQGLPLVGGYVTAATGSGDYEAAANNALDALARIRTGAAMSNSEKKFYQNLLPKAGDSQDTVNTKLSQLEDVFNTVVGGAQGQ